MSAPTCAWSTGRQLKTDLKPWRRHWTAEAKHEREQPNNPCFARLVSEDNLKLGKGGYTAVTDVLRDLVNS